MGVAFCACQGRETKSHQRTLLDFRAALQKIQGGNDVKNLQIATAIAAHISTRLVFALMLCISMPMFGSTVRATDKNKSSKSKAADSKKSKAVDKKTDKKNDKNAKNSKNSRNDKKREDSRSARNDRNSKNKKDDKRDKNAKSSKNDKRTTAKRDDKRDKKNSRDDKRSVAKREDNKRNSKNSRNEKNRKEVAKEETKKDPRKMSKKERLAEARRIAAEKRREEEARRRAAEEARRRAIEEARRREAEFLQKLKDDSITNIQNDDTTGEDMEVRRAAINALGDRAGTVVVMNPKTGQVYSVVNQEWALRKGFKPCSTVKLVTSVAGLTEGQINPQEEANYSPRRLNLVDALAFSNNGYFQSVGGRVGFEKMTSYAKELGLGEKTGINVPNESPGAIPQEKTGYAVNHMSSHGDDFEITPIQLATMVSALGNGGNLLKPTIVKTEQEKIRFKPQVRRKLNLPQQTIDEVMPGMVGAVNFGTAKGAQTPGYFIAGKTGSCTGQGTKLGLFASYGPVGDAQLAVVVVTRGPGQKGKVAAGVAGQIYRALSYRFTKPQNVPLARIPTTPRQRNPIVADEDDDAETAAQTNSNTNTTDANNKVILINKSTPKNAPSQQQQQQPLTQPQTYQQPKPQPTKPVEQPKQPISSNINLEEQRPRVVRP
jgi:hypothetical protein